jgi:hypothetical protein
MILLFLIHHMERTQMKLSTTAYSSSLPSIAHRHKRPLAIFSLSRTYCMRWWIIITVIA